MKWQLVLAGLAALIIAGLVAFAYLHGADLRVLNPQGPIGLEERRVIALSVLLPAVIIIPLFVMLFYFAWKYRAGGAAAQQTHEPNWDHDNWFAEAVWWVIPACIILCLSIVAWRTSYELDPFKPLQSEAPTMTIQVIALDWKWLFIYPQQGIATVNMVEFPKDTPVRFEITSDAPMNMFWIPSLGGQIMAMPGMTTQINLLANGVGEYNGLSSNISGDGFAGMTFMAKSVSQDDFNQWVQSVKAGSDPLTPSAYTTLAAPSTYVPVTYYSSVQGDLYTESIMKYMMPGVQMNTTRP
ncbi:MAG: COX aromatic rich motif-containing protein [Candidatus Pacebacteria bacterium]|nr:COX aromatic rich motif-containing protein [Candidatus Paceibacterota bacterium]